MERILEPQTVEGEIGLVIDYQPGVTLAVDVLQAAMQMVGALDRLDTALLSSVNSSLQPVSVLNDIQHSSLKMLLTRALKNVPDELISNPDWKKWVGHVLLKGKHRLLQNLEADAPQVRDTLRELVVEYQSVPGNLVGYSPPQVSEVMDALDGVAKARAVLPGQRMEVQTELGDIVIPPAEQRTEILQLAAPEHSVTNTGVEFLKIKSPDMLGSAQWQVVRNGRTVRVDMLHQRWLDAYHLREFSLLPGDSLKCEYEETVQYDAAGNEIERRLAVVQVLEVISPPVQRPLL
jgi:hypothetical protein